MKKIFVRILSILILIQPILSLYAVVNNPNLIIDDTHVITIIRYSIVALLGIYIFFTHKYF